MLLLGPGNYLFPGNCEFLLRLASNQLLEYEGVQLDGTDWRLNSGLVIEQQELNELLKFVSPENRAFAVYLAHVDAGL